jgi:hypothetical protein
MASTIMNLFICERLGLAKENWPPDHYALLGLPRGETDRQVIEARVHDRMQRVRPLQLIYPEEATEAMNRLAQALSCLTDPAARRQYDESLLTHTSPAPQGTPAEGEGGARGPSFSSEHDFVRPHDPSAWLFGPWDRLVEDESPAASSLAATLRDWTPSVKPPRRRKPDFRVREKEITSRAQENESKNAGEQPKGTAWFWKNSRRLFVLLGLLALAIALWRQISH